MMPKHSTPARSFSVSVTSSPTTSSSSDLGRSAVSSSDFVPSAVSSSNFVLSGVRHRSAVDRVLALLLMLLATAALVGCEGAGVGDPCIPEDEYRVEFSGYSKDEVNVESRSFQCETRVCLVNKFQGRVSCPYGQEMGESGCMTPDGVRAIEVPVDAQLVERRPSDAVYCSCRCSGPQGNAPYCECPDGFSCADLIDDIGLGNRQLAGGYCVKNGSNPESSQDINDTRCTGNTCGDPNDFY